MKTMYFQADAEMNKYTKIKRVIKVDKANSTTVIGISFFGNMKHV